MSPELPQITLWGMFTLGQTRWNAILAELAEYCHDRHLPSPYIEPKLFRYDGWGLLGFPPTIACNVSYFVGNEQVRIDGYRFTGKGYESK